MLKDSDPNNYIRGPLFASNSVANFSAAEIETPRYLDYKTGVNLNTLNLNTSNEIDEFIYSRRDSTQSDSESTLKTDNMKANEDQDQIFDTEGGATQPFCGTCALHHAKRSPIVPDNIMVPIR